MIGKIEGNNLIMMTRATPKVLALVSQLEGRRFWLKGGGLKIEDTPHNRKVFSDNFQELNLEGASEGFEEFDTQKAELADYNFKRKPDKHQVEALKRMHGRHVFGLFAEQGTGKTKVGIDRSGQLFCAGQITAVLVVTKKGVHRQWIEAELPKDCGVPYAGDWWCGKPVSSELLSNDEQTLKWFAINYDALRSKKAIEAVEEFCASHSGKLMIIADESHSIKSHTSNRHKAMTRLRPHSNYRLAMTGTPIAKDLTDEWAQLLWLDPRILGVKYITTFRAKYCIMGGFEGRAVVGHKNIEEFKAKVAPWSYRITKEQIGYIPKRFSEWVFDLTKEQKRILLDLKQELLVQFGDGQEIRMLSGGPVIAKMQQVTNGFLIDHEKKTTHQLIPVEKNPRANAMLEWMEANEGKKIIWCSLIEDRKVVAEALLNAGIKFVVYEGSDEKRHTAKSRFIEDDDVEVFIANPSSAGTGLDGLQLVCSQALYYSNSFNSIDRWQSEDRIDRRGMVGGSRYTDLIAKGSTDRYRLRSLKSKKGLSSIALGDVQQFFNDF